MTPENIPPKIGEILLDSGLITPEQLEQALELAAREGLRLGEALVEMGALDPDRLTWALGLQFDLSYVDLQPDIVDWDLLREVPIARLMDLRLVPLSRVGDQVQVVTSDPARADLPQIIAELFPYDQVLVQLASEESILSMLNEAERQLNRESLGSESRPSGISATPDDILSAMDLNGAARLAVVKMPDSQAARVCGLPEGTRIPSLMTPSGIQRLQAMLRQDFVEQVALPRGICAIRPAEDTLSITAVRAVTLTGPAGWLAVLERIPAEIPPHGALPIYVLEGQLPLLMKQAALRVGCEVCKDSELPLVSLEQRVDFLDSNVFQAELPDPAVRLAVCAHLVPALQPPAMVLEVESPEQALRAAYLPPPAHMKALLVVIRTPSAQLADGALPGHVRRLHLPNSEDAMEKLLRETVAEGVQ